MKPTRSPYKRIGCGITAFLQREFMVLSDEQFSAARRAEIGCQFANRPDHQYEYLQRMYRRDLARFAELCGSV